MAGQGESWVVGRQRPWKVGNWDVDGRSWRVGMKGAGQRELEVAIPRVDLYVGM